MLGVDAMIPGPNRVIAKRFRLIAELASGNMGSVWLADHLRLGMRCAVKFMARAALHHPSGRARFELEARAVACLESPHIVRVLDYDVEDDTPFIAMELLRGEELAARIARLGRLDTATTFKLVSEIAEGLSKAHAAGIVHRDLKPENVFLAQTDEGEVAKLFDFGIAKIASQECGCGTLEGETLGTPQYMSPEQVRGAKTIDHRSDLWSLAVVTHHCLIGRLPFDGRAVGDVFAKIVADPLPVPSRAAPAGVRVPPGFDRWWARAVSRDVERRFGSAREMVEALRHALDLGGRDESSPDVTAPPVGVSAAMAAEDPLVIPMRGRWRSKAVLVALATGVLAVTLLGRLRSANGPAAPATAVPLVAAAPPTVTAGWPTTSLQPLAASQPPAAPSAEELPHAANARRPSAIKSAAPRRSVPVATKVTPPATVKPSAAPSPDPPPTTRPTDDVDFGI